MPIGVCTWTFGQQHLATTASQIAALGLDGVELLGDLEAYSAQEAQQILGDTGLEVFSLTPTDADISHPDSPIRSQAIDYYYRLLDFAAALGRPIVSCHGLVGRIKPLSTIEAENALLVDAVQKIVSRAASLKLQVVFEVLNRYETHQIHNHQQALELLQAVKQPNFKVLLDAYHMNIEEVQPAQAILATNKHLGLFHVADSNRAGIGSGHTDFKAQFEALAAIDYQGAIILECTASGFNPFTPEKGGAWREELAGYLTQSLKWLKAATSHSLLASS